MIEDFSTRCLVKTEIISGFGNCGRPIVRDNKCIFHLENKTKEEAEEFEKDFWIEFEKMKRDREKLHFDNFIFPNPISFYFHSEQIDKPIYFTGAHFIKQVDFSRVTFMENAYFTDVEFKEDVDFSEVKFNLESDFSRVKFIKKSNFILSKFQSNAYFGKAIFYGEADFTHTIFGNAAYFYGAQFDNKIFFNYSTFMGEVHFISIKNESFNFRYCKLVKPELVRFNNIKLSIFYFLDTDISKVEFLNEKWIDDIHLVLDELKLKDNDTTYKEVAQLYRRLRRNYEDNYRFAEAGVFFFGEMEMLRLDVTPTLGINKLINIELWIKRNFSLLNIYKHLFLYGESYWRPTILAFIIILFYPTAHNLIKPLFNNLTDFQLFGSLASFFQMNNTYIGERIIGIPILGLLFIALKRKFERKK